MVHTNSSSFNIDSKTSAETRYHEVEICYFPKGKLGVGYALRMVYYSSKPCDRDWINKRCTHTADVAPPGVTRGSGVHLERRSGYVVTSVFNFRLVNSTLLGRVVHCDRSISIVCDRWSKIRSIRSLDDQNYIIV